MTPLKGTDPESVVAERFGKGEPDSGAPPDSPAPSGKGTGKKRGSYKKTRSAAPASPPAPRSEDDKQQGAALCSFLAATLWDLAAPLMKRRSISDDEAKKLGAAIDPVLYKYLPGMGEWALEINLLIVLATLFTVTKLEDKPIIGTDEFDGNGKLIARNRLHLESD